MESAERACGHFGPISSSNRSHTRERSGDCQCGSPFHSVTQQPPHQYADCHWSPGRFSESTAEVTPAPFSEDLCYVKMDNPAQLPAVLPCGDVVYMMSALLDPSFCFFWLEQDVVAPDEVKSEAKEMMITSGYKYTLFP